jgi:HAD superfamily hydrolase (TIGR01509 family)
MSSAAQRSCSGTVRPTVGQSDGSEPDLPQLVLFDMDDTIFDHTKTCRAAIGRVRRERRFLRRRSVSQLSDEYQRLLAATHPEVAVGRRAAGDARAERWRDIAAFCDTALDPQAAIELSDTYRAMYQSLRRPVDGAPEFLRRLHGRTRIGIVTNNEAAEQEEKIRYLGLERSVDLLVVSGEVGVTKPDPMIFRTALERASAEPEDAVMIGDSWENDVRGSLGAGIRPVWFNRFGLPRPERIPVVELASFRPLRVAERAVLGAGARADDRSTRAAARAL